MIAFAVLITAAVILVRRRARRKARLAGLEADRPAFSVAPPAGRLGSMKDGHL